LFSYLAVKVRAEQEGTSINYRKISRDDVLKLLVRCRLTFNNQEQLVELLETSCINNETIEEDLFLTLTELYKGTSNGYLSEIYEAITGEKAEVIGKVDELFKCPCCNRKTLSESYDSKKGTGYDICDYCRWEDDGTTEIDTHSGVNRGTISEYRSKIQENPNLYYKEKWYLL